MAGVSRAVVAVGSVAVACGLATAAEADPSAPEIAGWIEQLGSSEFARREAASKGLLAAGLPAVEPLAAAILGSDLEVASRGIEVLRELLVQEPIMPAAEAALEACAEAGDPAAARLAEAALAFHQVGLAAAARMRLEELGAVFREQPAVEFAGLEVEFGRGWKGAADDLRALPRLPRLDALSFHGVPLDERALVVIGRLKSLERLEIYGTGVDEQALAVLAAKLPDAQIDFRRGGKLGLGGLALGGPCEIQTVEPGSAADQAGIRPGDVVLAVDGTAVADFEGLTARVAGRGPGETMRLSVDRRGAAAGGDVERLEFEVRLDAW